MDKQTFVLSIIKHYICDKFAKGECPKSGICDEKVCEELKNIACKACKVYDHITAHVRAHEKSPDGTCHL